MTFGDFNTNDWPSQQEAAVQKLKNAIVSWFLHRKSPHPAHDDEQIVTLLSEKHLWNNSQLAKMFVNECWQLKKRTIRSFVKAQGSDAVEIDTYCSGHRQWQLAAHASYRINLLALVNFCSNFQKLFAGMRQIRPG